jgi:WD40 repeat protein
LVTAAQDNNVCYYSTENWEYLGLLTRTENMISHVAFDADGKYLSISAKEDNKLKILNVAHLAYPVKDTNKTVTQHILNDSEGGVRFSAFDPKVCKSTTW